MPFALNGNVRIHYEVVGEGPSIVLHTGGLGDMSMWQDAGYVAGLDGYKRVLIDHRGHGQSDKPKDLESHRMRKYVGDVVSVLDQLGIYRSAFFGFSEGGRVGFSLASEYPGRVAALIALGACVDGESSEAIQIVRSLKKEGGYGLASYVSDSERREGITNPEWLRRNFLRTDSDMFALELEGWTNCDGAARLAPKIGVPTLLLTGAAEDPNSDCAKIAKLIPRASVVSFPGLGHVGAFLRSDLVLQHVKNFLLSVQHGLDRRFS